MDQKISQLIGDACKLYQPIALAKGCPIRNGNVLWEQFEAAASTCATGSAGSRRQLREKINELATARVLAEDKNLTGEISYEPKLLTSGRRIDFVAERADDNLYVEVKSVYPETPDTQKTWERYQELREHHPTNVVFIVEREWRGGEFYGDSFAARSKFLTYSMAFEERLAEAQCVRPGPGIIVFCGSGFQWDVDQLEDFADFYLSGRHRADDPFAMMERFEMDKPEYVYNKILAISHFCIAMSWKHMFNASVFRCVVRTLVDSTPFTTGTCTARAAPDLPKVRRSPCRSRQSPPPFPSAPISATRAPS